MVEKLEASAQQLPHANCLTSENPIIPSQVSIATYLGMHPDPIRVGL
jgi:hypothetical protein